jgi:hypothetical protein
MQHSYINGAKLNALLRQQLPRILARWGDSHRHSGGKTSITELNIDLRTIASLF